jgi:predicted NAD/FAD-dependent oxidoreductase
MNEPVGHMKRGAPRVAVIGAGIAGLTCARTLALHSAAVTVFDEESSPGGRLMTRRVGLHAFDLGAQYFTVRDPRFAEQVRDWTKAGTCEPWQGRLVAAAEARAPFRDLTTPIQRVVGRPGMSNLGHALAADLDLRAQRRVGRIEQHGAELRLFGGAAGSDGTLKASDASDEPLGTYDRIAICVPPTRAADLLAELSPSLAATAAAVQMAPCVALGWAAAESDAAALRALPFDGAFIGRADTGEPLTWIARDSSKPGRPEGECWVLHASAAWSQQNQALSDEQITRALLSELAACVGIPVPSSAVVVVQRWALARALNPLGAGPLYDAALGVGVAGDWTGAGQIEGAFLEGLALATRLLDGAG